MNYDPKNYLENLIIPLNFPINTKTKIHLRDICFYNKAVDLTHVFPFYSLGNILSKEEADIYSFITHHQHLFLDKEKMTGEDVLLLIKDKPLAFFETEVFSEKNSQMILNIAMINSNIDLVALLINKNIIPNSKHHSLFQTLLINDRAIEIIQLLEEKKFFFDYSLFSYIFKHSLYSNNIAVFNYFINQIEQDSYILDKTFFDFYNEKLIDKYKMSNFNKTSTLLIEENSLVNLLFQKLSKEKFENILNYVKITNLREDLKQYYFKASLENSLAIPTNHFNKIKI